MSRVLRSATTKLALSLGAVVFGTGAALAAMAGTSGGATATVDHQLCYTAVAKGFKIPTNVSLVNQFSPRGFTPKISAVQLHCNPVAKTLPTGQMFPITNPDAHLVCFKITATKQPTPTVIVTNQFGQATLVPGQPNLLCLPSWKSLTGPTHKKPSQPPGLDHFTCYPVTVSAGAYKPPPVLLQDQFSAAATKAQVTPVPAELCLPTQKTVGTHVYRIINPTLHLLCFPVTPTPVVPKVFDQNQFGTATISIRQTKWLCVPSTKQLH
jgi:hypothetical protein